MLSLAAGGYRYRPLREGISGWDGWALQRALDIPADGVFGPVTTGAVKRFQKAHDLTADGIAGPATQRDLAEELIWPVQKQLATPPGLLRGLMEGESGYLLGNYTAPYRDGSRDVGLMMHNLAPTQHNLTFAFDGRLAIPSSAVKLNNRRVDYLKLTKNDRSAWRYAIGAHNWPAAADRYAAGTIDRWVYVSRGVSYRMTDPAPWIIEQGVAGVRTGHEWFAHYVDSKLQYCAALR
jgi:hypothetical protein